MTMQPADDGVGARIRARRLSLGKSLRAVSGAAGISHSTLKRIEDGDIRPSNRFLLANIAAALRCPVDHLAGVVVPSGRDGAETTAAGYETIRALLECDLDFLPGPDPGLPPIAALTAAADQAVTLRQACDYARLVRMLPPIVRGLYVATAGPDGDIALRALIRVAEAASFAVRYTGQPAAATVASDACRRAAAELGNPTMIAFGEWARAHSALGCGLHERAGLITGKAIRELDGAPEEAGRLEMLGMLHLTHAFALVGAGRMADAADPLAEASVLARRTGETDTWALMFGPTNVRLWELAILCDGGDPLDALHIAAGVNVQVINSVSRQATFHVDTARAAHKVGENARAVQHLEAAERLAPQRVHGDPLVVEMVRGMLDTARRHAEGTRLRGLAQRVGVAA